ncbi:58R [Xanthomonas phage Xp10]|uniref:58R n=1 Tax=Xanthomonas phage Xp10 TaxID=2907956 RepID=Q7Y5F8_9CAUD|nr:hypothetical protein Xp10p59 [Xanthomonas phage Xp10]AAP58726.1 58R [Xanthomonas phage Xp10]
MARTSILAGLTPSKKLLPQELLLRRSITSSTRLTGNDQQALHHQSQWWCIAKQRTLTQRRQTMKHLPPGFTMAFNESTNELVPMLKIEDTQHFLGYYPTPAEAYAAVRAAYSIHRHYQDQINHG